MTDMLDFESTADIEVPNGLIDQVIGQDHAAAVIRLAARKRRAVLLVGQPGTGKSMLAAAMAEMMPAPELHDVLVRANADARLLPRIETLPAGAGRRALAEAAVTANRERRGLHFMVWVGVAGSLLLGGLLAVTLHPLALLLGVAAAVLILVLRRRVVAGWSAGGVRVLIDRSDQPRAPFVDATGAHAGGLLGDVRHDPYQSGGFETEPHELVEAGAIHRADGGVLFVDEITSLTLESQQRLLTALQEGELAITGRHSASSGAMVRTDPVPCDTVLVVASNPEELEYIHPALRSRLRGFGFEVVTDDSMPNTAANRLALARFAAQEVRRDGSVPHLSADAVRAMIAEAERRAGPARLTLRLRELGGLVRIAGDLASSADAALTEAEHVEAAVTLARSAEEQLSEGRGDESPNGRPAAPARPLDRSTG
jgi:Lon-like ATP-dependent protease